MIEWFVPRASSFAADIDHLFLLIGLIMGGWFLAGEGVLLYFIFKFRRQKNKEAQYITGEKKEEKKWLSRPHFTLLAFDIVLVIAAVSVWVHVKQKLPTPDAKIRVIGQQWAWTFVHPGPDNKLGTMDDITKVDELHLEIGKTYHFELESKDVLHSFSVPVFRLKQDAVPGRIITGWFRPTLAGKFDIQCAEMCGIGHGIMSAKLFIESPEDHLAWMSQFNQSSVSLQENEK